MENILGIVIVIGLVILGLVIIAFVITFILIGYELGKEEYYEYMEKHTN